MRKEIKMSETTVIANNAISVIPMVDSKGNPIEWTPNKKRAYDRMVAKRWARALRRIPNFKSMKPEQIEAWHNRETWKGLKEKDLITHLRSKDRKDRK